jgi:protein-tyrosine phosphatase
LKSILFVCTGNIFRSMTAEHALKAVLGPEPVYHVSSAGTGVIPQEMHPVIKTRLRERGIDPTGHRMRQITGDILNGTDLVVAMGLDHRAYVKERFGCEAVLFNQICCGQEEPILDVGERVPAAQNEVARQAYAITVVDHICDSMPAFIANVERYLVQ